MRLHIDTRWARGVLWHGEILEGKSATPAGTVLTGLSIFKDKPDPVAHPDTWYPSWLWDVNTRRGVEEESNTGPGGLGAWHLDTTGMTKGQARTAEKRLVRERRRQMRLAEKARLRKEALLAEKLARGEKIEEEDPEEAWRLAEQEAERKKKEEHEYYLRTGITPRLQAVHESKAKLSQKGRASIREANFVKKSA